MPVSGHGQCNERVNHPIASHEMGTSTSTFPLPRQNKPSNPLRIHFSPPPRPRNRFVSFPGPAGTVWNHQFVALISDKIRRLRSPDCMHSPSESGSFFTCTALLVTTCIWWDMVRVSGSLPKISFFLSKSQLLSVSI